MKSLRLILSQPVFLIKISLKNLDPAAIQLGHLEFSLITLFVIIIFFEPMLFVYFQQLKQYVCIFYNVGNISLTTYFKAFDFI